jgi:hypothetical protein
MSTSFAEKTLTSLRRLEFMLGQLPQRVSAWMSPLHWKRHLLRIPGLVLRLRTHTVGGGNSLAELLGRLKPFAGSLLQLPSHLSQWARNLPRFSLTLREAPGQTPAIASVCACLFAGVITLSPEVGEIWSEQTYPAVAAVDRLLAPHGVIIGPEVSTPETPVSRPIIAVVFGSILPDETVQEQQRDVHTDIAKAPVTAKLRDITRPAHWQRKSVAPRVASESFEIRD